MNHDLRGAGPVDGIMVRLQLPMVKIMVKIMVKWVPMMGPSSHHAHLVVRVVRVRVLLVNQRLAHVLRILKVVNLLLHLLHLQLLLELELVVEASVCCLYSSSSTSSTASIVEHLCAWEE